MFEDKLHGVYNESFFNKQIQEMLIAMPTHDVFTHTGEYPYEPDAALVYCDLFGDNVAEHVCHLLKKELNAWWRGDSSCRGCCRHWLR